MIQIIADGARVYDKNLGAYVFKDDVLVYDSRLVGAASDEEDYSLVGLQVTGGLNKGGTAEVTMPAGHPSYNDFVGHRTIVNIYRDGALRFRGRVLYPTNDYNNNRTITCEGELCFLQDAVSRPYLYQDSPDKIFTAVVGEYNAQVDTFKQFKVGSITVTDPNSYIRIEAEEAESVLDTVNKLLERCGGYIEFTTDDTGARVINWLTTVGSLCGQTVEAGENMFDFSSSDANTDLATALIPYGAKEESTGKRLTVASVNGGKDYIVDETASALRGLIVKTATWDDVTDPNNLLTKARQYLNEAKLVVTSLVLTALDLSYIDKTVDSFKLGDLIRVISRAHGVDENFQLVEYSEDLLNPGNSYITLGKEIRTLTGLDVAGDTKGQSELQKATTAIKQDFDINVQQSVNAAMESEATVQKLTSIIQQQAGSITLQVSGSLGGNAEISLSAFGKTSTAQLDLANIRQAFANDTSAVSISGGTITFSSNTLIVNSTNLQVSEDGTITATNAVLSGTATTENGDYKSELSGGRLRFFYAGTEYGGIASGYMGDDSSVRGVAVRLEQDAKYIGFSKLDAEGDGYDLTYCINYGANPGGRTERHIFHGNTYFHNNMIVNGMMNVNSSFAVKGHIGINGAYSLKFLNSAGEYIDGFGISTNDKLSVGSDGYDLFVYGNNVCLGHSTDGLVQIRGAESNVTSPFTFGNTATFNSSATFNGQASFNAITFYNNFAYFTSNAYFLANTIASNNTGMKGQNASGSDTIWMAAVNNSNEVILGDADYTTYIQGASILIGTGSSTTTVRSNLRVNGAVQVNNNYGVLIKNTSGSDCSVLNINTSNQVNVGNLDYPMYLRGTHVTVNTGNFTVYQGSVVLSNGYGIQGKDTSGNPYYILSVTTGNQVGVGATGLPLYLRGTGVYLASSGATVTSDRRKKNSIEALPDAYEALLDRLTPVRYKYNDGTSGRYHAGFIAQDVKAALEAAGLSTKDFGGFVDINGDGEELGLIYSEFIALLLHKIKRQEQRIAALEAAH